MPHMTKELRKLAKAARAAGWEVEPTRRGHWKFLPIDLRHAPIFTSSTPSDPRAMPNLRARLERAGLRTGHGW
ncbi:hypothetical protein GCM10025777_31560 [Membranihabitans marinus]|uniref:Type II toxin-antitoxin system HicA family toxin n=1 Tax=Nesterenkonia rhizosphaerae TaxID=1348272 RepID=A0ABP9FTQ6_9MICC